jgi:hypothetical protein
VAFFSGDNLASQEIGGFKIGSASALKCRECMGNAADVSSKVNNFIKAIDNSHELEKYT